MHPRVLHSVLITLLLAAVASAVAPRAFAQQSPESVRLIQGMIAQEKAAASTRGRYLYAAEERSERSGGHLWTEREVETRWGTLRYVLAEDGKPLSPARRQAELAHLAEAAKDPEAFLAEEQKEDESPRAQALIGLLTRAFCFAPPQSEGSLLRIAFQPDPGFTPHTIEERVLHGIHGTVLLEAKTLRLIAVEGRLPSDVSLGFGPFATLRAGSNFLTRREHIAGPDWKATTVHTDVKGRALLFKTLTRQQDARYADFQRIPDSLTLAQAAVLLQDPSPAVVARR